MVALKNIAILFFCIILIIILYETNKSESFNPLPEACIICPTSSSGAPIYDGGKTCHAKMNDVNGGELGITRFEITKVPKKRINLLIIKVYVFILGVKTLLLLIILVNLIQKWVKFIKLLQFVSIMI